MLYKLFYILFNDNFKFNVLILIKAIYGVFGYFIGVNLIHVKRNIDSLKSLKFWGFKWLASF